MSHSNDVSDAVAAMLAMGTPSAAVASKPPDPPQTPPPPPAAPSEPEPPEPAVPSQQAAKAPKPKPKPPAKAAPSAGGKKQRTAVLMDRDLLPLIALAQPALGGLTLAQVYMTAAREYRLVAADLPSTPLATTVIDDIYDEVVTESAHRTMLSPYMTESQRVRFDADADDCGLDRSEFIRRVVRAFLTIDKAFVPESKAHLLTETYLDPVLDQLKVQVASGRPAAVLPDPAGQRWTMVRLPVGSPLRALTDEARDAMRGCTSATQALLTVL